MPDRIWLPRSASRQVPAGSARVGPLMSVPALLAELGADPDETLRRAGLTLSWFDDPDNVLPMTAIGDLLTACVEVTGRDDFGLRVGMRASMSSLGAVGFLMKSSPTVGHALQALAGHLGTQDRSATIDLAEDGGFATISYQVLEPRVRALDQIYALAAAVCNGALRTMCGEAWRPREIRLPFGARSAAAYREALGAPIVFEADRCSMVFPAAVLARRLDTADPLLYKWMSERIREIESVVATQLADRARQLLTAMVLLSPCTRGALARRMGLTPRTLNRHLAAEATSFSALRDEARRVVACELLANTAKSVQEIGVVLGYAPAAFTRAFARWTGRSPAQWRAEHRRARGQGTRQAAERGAN